MRDVYLGAGGALKAMRRGAVCFKLSKSSVALAKEIAAQAAKKGVVFLDAPVSGSVPHLERKGSLGHRGWGQGRAQEHRDVLDAFSKSVTYMGKSGNGLIMKLVAETTFCTSSTPAWPRAWRSG